MKRRILVRPAAANDLDDEAAYIARDSTVETALRFLEAADTTFWLLARRPGIGRLYGLKPPLEAIRSFPVKGFTDLLVFYRPVRRGIEVVRVLHGAREIQKLFGA